MKQGFHESTRKGTGSSLADVSDMSERDDPREYASTDRIIQHPYKGIQPVSYRLAQDRAKNDHILVPKFSSQGPGAFPQNTTRRPARPSTNAPETSPGFAGRFSRDDDTPKPNRQSIFLDLESRWDSYQTLDSDIKRPDHGTENIAPSNDVDKTGRFRWSRIRETLGRDPPKTTPTIWDQPLYKLGIKSPNEPKKLPHVPHDEFLGKYARLPFRLISLPEASMLQQFRRQRGEEDHTEPARSMTGKISAMDSSVLPRTPSPVRLRSSAGSQRETITRSARVHHNHTKDAGLHVRDSSERIADMLVSSSAILGTSPTAEPRTMANLGWYKGLSHDDSALYEGLSRARGFSTSTLERRHRRHTGCTAHDASIFTPSEAHLIETARENILTRRRLYRNEQDRRDVIFVGIIILTVFFPFIGLLALRGKFDSAISWNTHGEMHSLPGAQRRKLQILLFAEVAVYPALIITLSIYYATRG